MCSCYNYWDELIVGVGPWLYIFGVKMQTRYRFILVISLALVAANASATITCGKPKLSKIVGHDPIYHFKAVVTCKLVGEKINIQTLKDSYRDEIMSHKSQFVVHDQHNYDNKNGLLGYWLDATQSYNSDHGAMAVRAEILLLDDNTKNFYMELRSKSIKAEDDAKYDKTILNEVSLQHFTDHDDLTVTKEIDVEEPWYAPEGMFFDTVETELSESIRKAALLHTRKISGEQVEALRK